MADQRIYSRGVVWEDFKRLQRDQSTKHAMKPATVEANNQDTITDLK